MLAVAEEVLTRQQDLEEAVAVAMVVFRVEEHLLTESQTQVQAVVVDRLNHPLSRVHLAVRVLSYLDYNKKLIIKGLKYNPNYNIFIGFI